MAKNTVVNATAINIASTRTYQVLPIYPRTGYFTLHFKEVKGMFVRVGRLEIENPI